jgi:hypothetical protein
VDFLFEIPEQVAVRRGRGTNHEIAHQHHRGREGRL